MKKTLLTLLVCCFFSGLLKAQTVVVVHPDNAAQLSEKQIKRIFLGKEKKFPNGEPSIPVNQTANSSARNEFDSNTLGRSTAQISAYWSKLVFTGKGIPPKEVSSDAEVIELIKQNKSVIGYIDASSATADVKIIAIQ